MRVDLPLDKKLWKIRAGPPGRGAVAGRGPRAAGLSGRQAAEPSRAVGRGPLGRGPAFSKTLSFYWQKLVHATEYHLQKKIANVIYGGILKQDD